MSIYTEWCPHCGMVPHGNTGQGKRYCLSCGRFKTPGALGGGTVTITGLDDTMGPGPTKGAAPLGRSPVDTLRAAEAVRERIVRALEAEVRDRPTAERLADAVVRELGKA